MTDYSALFRRRAMMVNSGKNIVSYVRQIEDTPSGGLHVKALIYAKKYARERDYYIPGVLMDAFKQEKPNDQLNSIFRL